MKGGDTEENIMFAEVRCLGKEFDVQTWDHDDQCHSTF